MASGAIYLSCNRVGKANVARDYYVILGVESDASPEQIKSAYRRAAKRCHPDQSGGGSEPFLAIQEAYDVLGDPGRRRAYDDQLAREKKRSQPGRRPARPEPLRRRRSPVEPLVPTRRPSAPRNLFFESPFPSLIEELLRRPWSDLETWLQPGARRGTEEFHIEVTLTREQALHGGHLRIWVPVQMRCPACRGWGGRGFFDCPDCFGSGTVVDEYPLDVAFPGGLADGSTASVPLSRPGMSLRSLVLHFRVDDG